MFNYLNPLRRAKKSCGKGCTSRSNNNTPLIFKQTQTVAHGYSVYKTKDEKSNFCVVTLCRARANLHKILYVFLLSAISMNSTSFASDNDIIDPMAHGEKEHKSHCVRCHGSEVYTREDRFIKSIDALSKQVVRCRDNLDVPWFDEDTDAVVQFLNNKYYRF